MNASSLINASCSYLARVAKSVVMLFVFGAFLIGAMTTHAQPTAAAPTPALPAAKVLSMYNSSGTYADHAGINWYASWSGAAGSDYTIPSTTSTVKKYGALQYAGVEFYDPSQINAGAYDTLHIDLWTPTADQFGVKLVSLSPTADPEVDFLPASGVITSGGWVSLDIPLSQFTSANPGLVLSHLQQLLWIDNLGGGGVVGADFYIDNVYFSSPTNVVTTPSITNVLVDSASSWVGYYYDVTDGFGGPTDITNLVANFSGSSLTLTPNIEIYPIFGASTIDSSLYVQNDALAGKKVVFSGTCTAKTLGSPYTSEAFIKEFDNSYSLVSSTNLPLSAGSPFVLSLVTAAGHHIQYGFETVGPSADSGTVAGLGSVIISALAPPVNVNVDPAKTWVGYMNVFALPADGGGYVFGSPWGTADLNASFAGAVATLTPNTSISRDVPTSDGFWWTPAGNGNKTMDASFYVQDDTLAGQTVVFSSYCWTNTLVSPYTSVAFIKVFAPDYSSSTLANVPLVTGQAFSLSLAAGAGTHVQYGIETVGPNASLASVASLGNVVVASTPPPASVRVDTSTGWVGGMNVFALPADGGGYVFSSGWGLADLNASLDFGVATLTPNTSISRDVPTSDGFWWKPDGSGNKNMDANLYVEDNTLADHSVIFSGNCFANTLVSPYTSKAFIQEFDGAFNIVTQTNVLLVTGQPFNITLVTTAFSGHHIRYGFTTVGPNASLASAPSLGHVLVGTPVALVIGTQPLSVTNGATTTATFTVVATGANAYQWYKGASPLTDGGNISGATTATLTLNNVLAATAGSYHVVVFNYTASTTSSSATLTVRDPAILAQPASQVVATGSGATFNVGAAGTSLTYQWKQNGTNAPYATSHSATLTIPAASAALNGVGYSVVVSNSLGQFVTSSTAYLGVTATGVAPAPTVSVTAPMNNTDTASAGINLLGKATDTTRVSAVQISLNGGAFVNANLTNPVPTTATWGLPLTLATGTNIVRVKSVNYLGTASPVVTNRYFLRVLSSFALVTNTSGAGTVTISPALPAYIGRTYRITATPSSTSLLSNIVNAATSGTTVVPNSAPLKALRSVAVLAEAANTVTINFVTNRFIGVAGSYNGLFIGTRTAGGLVTVPGAANVYVDHTKTWNGYMNVFDLGMNYQWGSPWATSDLPASFSGDVATLSPNVNVYNAADSYWANPDGSGAKIMEANYYVEDNSLAGQTVAFSGYCQTNTLVSPYTSIAFIKVNYGTAASVALVSGQPFTLNVSSAATAGAFNIQYGFATTGPDANPATVASLGHVLVSPSAPTSVVSDVKQQSAGFISVKTTSKLAYSGTLYVDGDVVKGLAGTFDLDGKSTATVLRTNVGKPALTVKLNLAFDDTISGSVSNSTDGWSSVVAADRAVFSTLAPTTTLNGNYTMLIPGLDDAANGPIGDGFASITIKPAGAVTGAGFTADNQPLKTLATSVSKNGRWPMYAPQYLVAGGGHNGSVIGWVQFTSNAPTATFSGDITWIKTGWTNGYYNGGFTNHAAAVGSVFTAPANLNFASATATYSSGEFASLLTDQLSVAAGVTISTVNATPVGTKYTYMPAKGLLTATKSTNYVGSAMSPIKGCYLQNQNYIGGYFLGTNQAGQLLIQ